MIKNRRHLLKNLSGLFRTRREILFDIVDDVLKNLAPEKLMRGALPKKSLKKFNRVTVIGIGKAARGMVKGILPFLGRKPDEILFADTGHPLPTKKGVLKTQKIIRSARSLGEKDLAVVLMSGGGSSMLVSPAPGITLVDKMNITKSLLRSGAPIHEMNVVRKHLSQVKGGRLASLLYPATVWGFIISDVVWNDLSTIASGPLSPDTSTFSDALLILKKYRIKASPHISHYLETPKPDALPAGRQEKYFKKVSIKIIADHHTAAQKAFEKAKKMGLKIAMAKQALIGEAKNASKWFISHAKKNALLIGFGETTVMVRGNGYGGRNEEFVLSGLPYLKPNQTLLSIGTDGVDGICPEPIAGAIADSTTLEKAKKLKLNAHSFLRQNNSYEFFKKTNGLIKTGPTGTNLGDLMLLISENP